MIKKRSAAHLVLSCVLGLMLFLIFIYLANIFAPTINVPILSQFVLFINENIYVLIGITLLFFAADFIGLLSFPFNLPSPFFRAAGSIFLIAFAVQVCSLVQAFTQIALADIISPFVPLTYFLVFVLVLIINLIAILWQAMTPRQESTVVEVKVRRAGKTWSDVGDEFRDTLSAILGRIRKKANGEKNNKK
jgi:hypothetical protein